MTQEDVNFERNVKRIGYIVAGTLVVALGIVMYEGVINGGFNHGWGL